MKHSDVTQTEIVWLNLNPELLNERERYWSKVSIKDVGCWEWTGGFFKRSSGLWYGAFKSEFFGNNVVAHRMAFLFTKGFIPLGNHVHLRHLCNNSKCCNPDHLALGTATDNAADKVVAGTQPKGDSHYARREPWRLCRGDAHKKAHAGKHPRGESSHRAVLTAAIVIDARIRKAAGERVCDIADSLGVSRKALYQAILGMSWKHITDPPPVKIWWKK